MIGWILVLGGLLGLAIFVIVCLVLTLRENTKRLEDSTASNKRLIEVNRDFGQIVASNTKFMGDANEEWFNRCEDYRQRLETELKKGDKDA